MGTFPLNLELPRELKTCHALKKKKKKMYLESPLLC